MPIIRIDIPEGHVWRAVIITVDLRPGRDLRPPELRKESSKGVL